MPNDPTATVEPIVESLTVTRVFNVAFGTAASETIVVGSDTGIMGRVALFGADDLRYFEPQAFGASGGGGDDVFVITRGIGERTPGQSEALAVIADFDEGDRLDVSHLGPADNASILGREAIVGGQRVSIDYDADGVEDGFVITLDAKHDFGFVFEIEGPGGIGDDPSLRPTPTEPDGGPGGAPIDFLPGLPGDGDFTLLPAIVSLGGDGGFMDGWFAF